MSKLSYSTLSELPETDVTDQQINAIFDRYRASDWADQAFNGNAKDDAALFEKHMRVISEIWRIVSVTGFEDFYPEAVRETLEPLAARSVHIGHKTTKMAGLRVRFSKLVAPDTPVVPPERLYQDVDDLRHLFDAFKTPRFNSEGKITGTQIKLESVNQLEGSEQLTLDEGRVVNRLNALYRLGMMRMNTILQAVADKASAYLNERNRSSY